MAGMQREQIAQLVRAAQAGDRGAMDQLLRTAYKNVLFQCRKIMKHPEDAEDMAQEVLFKIYETLGSLREPERFISWANTIATRRCINERTRNPKDLQFSEDETGNSILDNLEELDQQAIPDAALDNAETRRMVQELVDQLPDLQRVTVVAYYNAGMSVREIAEEMGVSENTVKSRLLYGRRAIEKGVKDYEKQGIKLYGLSPLPFLLYFLRSAAEEGTGEAAAAAAASAALSGGAAGAAGASSAAGYAAGAASAGSAAGSGAAAGAGLLGGLGAKVTAIVLVGALAVGGGALLLNRPQATRPTEAPGQLFQPSQPGQSIQPSQSSQQADPDAPVPLASYTMRRTTVAESGSFGGIYLETPEFDEINEGYRQINACFDQLHQSFHAQGDSKVAAMLAQYESGDTQAAYTRTSRVVYQDGYYVSVSFRESIWPQGLFPMDARIDYTFDVRTGALLELSDLYEGTDEEVAEWVAEAIRSSEYGSLLTADNYPSADDGFSLAAVSTGDPGLGVLSTSGYEQGQALYTWHIDDTIDDMTIPLPVRPERISAEE